MKKIILILCLALLSFSAMAQNVRQPDSLLVYSFASNVDSTLNVIDARTYNSEGLLQTRKRIMFKDYVVLREKGVYNTVYSYSNNGNERTTTISRLDDSNDTIEKEVYTYTEDKLVYSFQSYSIINGEMVPENCYIKTFKGIRNYESNEMIDLFMYSGMTIFDYAEIPLYFADTITLERKMVADWVKVGEYIFTFDEDNRPSHLLYTGTLSAYDIDNYYFFYDNNGQCIKIDRYVYVSKTETIKDIEIMPLSSGPNQKIIYISTTPDCPYVVKCKYIFNYDNDGNLLSRFHYDVTDSLDTGIASDKYYYIYNSPNSIQEHTTTNISVFPNPAQSQFTVSHAGDAEIELYNLLGQRVKQIVSTEENTIVRTDNLPAGMYILQVKRDKAVFTKKVQVIR